MILDQILTQKQIEISTMPDISESTLQKSDRDFLGSIRKNKGHAVIAELKSKSPSEGVICEPYHPMSIAREYEAGGAAGISVLTDGPFFNGSFEHLKAVREAVKIPVMCKEFILDVKQIKMARKMGADACLLIVRILTDEQLETLYHEILKWNMTPLVEVFDEPDCIRAKALGAQLIGVNNRNLDTLKMDTANSQHLRGFFDQNTTVLSLSGAKTPEDAKRACQQLDGVLIGTALMRSKDRVGFLRSMC